MKEFEMKSWFRGMRTKHETTRTTRYRDRETRFRSRRGTWQRHKHHWVQVPESEEQDQNALQETAAHTYSWTPHVYHPERTTAQQSLRIKAVQRTKLPPSHSHDLQFSLHEVHCNVRQSVPQPPASLKLSNYMFDSAWSCSFPVTIKTLLVC